MKLWERECQGERGGEALGEISEGGWEHLPPCAQGGRGHLQSPREAGTRHSGPCVTRDSGAPSLVGKSQSLEDKSSRRLGGDWYPQRMTKGPPMLW